MSHTCALYFRIPFLHINVSDCGLFSWLKVLFYHFVHIITKALALIDRYMATWLLSITFPEFKVDLRNEKKNTNKTEASSEAWLNSENVIKYCNRTNRIKCYQWHLLPQNIFTTDQMTILFHVSSNRVLGKIYWH